MSIEFIPPTSFKEQLNEAVLFPQRVVVDSYQTIKKTSIGIGSTTKKNILTRHVVTRAAFLTGVLLAVTTRTVDLALGIFAACASILTIGAIPKINTFAVQHLKATSIIHDICGGLRGIINPFQYIRLPK